MGQVFVDAVAAVSLTMTPEGVEHMNSGAWTPKIGRVSLTMTPEGVEHILLDLPRALLAGCP